ncbi:MAG: ATP-binding protein [Kiritimatiellae bacterium]|nr:ATP-binding protein [Kiritimatiellia bacterium]
MVTEVKKQQTTTKPLPKSLSILLAEDSEDDALLLIRHLRENGIIPEYTRVYTRPDCAAALEKQNYDLIIADYTMPQFTALNIIEMVKERQIDTPIIVVSGTIGEDAAVNTMRAGACDYIMKGSMRRLIPAIERELEEAKIRKAHKRAKKVNQLLSTAIEQAAETVVITDTKGVIEYANPAFQNITGYSRDEALGKSISIMKSGKHNDVFYKELWTTISSGRVWQGLFKNKRKNGTLYEEEVTISPVRDGSGNITNYVAVKRDITHEMELEQQLSQAQKLKAIGQFAHKVAHDFTNVLMMILGNAELAKKELPPSSGALHYISEITNAANRITSFVAELMAFAHMSPPKTTTIRIDRIITGIEEIIKKATSPAITFNINIKDPCVKAKVDVSRIEQVIVHMVDNSVDAMPQGGTLTIEVSSTATSAEDAMLLPASLRNEDEPADKYAILTIKDTGCGIAEDIQSRIFEPFFTTKKTKHNVGLGLAMVYKIVEQHDGQITVHSAPGQGATFRIFLPMPA